jgi:hypothetical protein
MKCVKTMSTTDIGNVFLFLYTLPISVVDIGRYRAEHFFRKSKYKSGDLNELSKTHFPS